VNWISAAIRANPLVIDAAIALGLTALALFAVAAGAPDLGPEGLLNIGLLLLQTVPLAVRRRFPVAVLAVVAGGLVAQLLLLPEGGSLRAVVGVLLAVFTVGDQLPRRISLLLTLLVIGSISALQLELVGLPSAVQQVIQTSLILFAAWFAGDAFRTRRLYARSLEERAQLLQRERQDADRRAVLEERERIARDLHDAVSHHVSVIVIQAGGALRAMERRPAEARTALEAIEGTGRQALTEMRRMLGILGEAGSPEPVPGLDRLGDLLEKVRAAGLPVELSVQGARRDVDPGVELAAYRIIQECLTNALKHARGGKARVSVRYEPGSLDLSVENERGAGRHVSLEPPHEGRGLLGMRERVAMFRGTLEAGRTASGFRVTARLPLDEAVSGG
jgi:signal transduction histidine kinase